jgi:ABC-2 type transport system permease protein
MKMWALITDTLREIYARKVIIGIVVIEVITLIITGFTVLDWMQEDYQSKRESAVDTTVSAPKAPIVEHDSETTELLGVDTAAVDSDSASSEADSGSSVLQEVPVAGAAPDAGESLILVEQVRGQLGVYGGMTIAVTIALAIFATAGIVPSLMEKGTIDLLLSKPIPRWKILWGRVAGGVLAIAANLLVFTLASWILYGIGSGVWYTPYLWYTLLFGFSSFIVIFSLIIALNVVTESWVLPMSLAYVHVVVLANFLAGREATLFEWIESRFVHRLLDGLYWILPQTNELIFNSKEYIHAGTVYGWTPFIQGAIFTAVMAAFATWRFQRKDF